MSDDDTDEDEELSELAGDLGLCGLSRDVLAPSWWTALECKDDGVEDTTCRDGDSLFDVKGFDDDDDDDMGVARGDFRSEERFSFSFLLLKMLS